MNRDQEPVAPLAEAKQSNAEPRPIRKNGTADTWSWIWKISQKPIPLVEMKLPNAFNNKKARSFFYFLKKVPNIFANDRSCRFIIYHCLFFSVYLCLRTC